MTETQIEAWREAAASLPSDEEIANLRNERDAAEAHLTEATHDFAVAVVRKALVRGFATVGEEYGITAKQLRNWRRQYLPDDPDLSAIPAKEAAKEQRRIEREEREYRKAQEMAARLDEIRADLDARRERAEAMKEGNL